MESLIVETILFSTNFKISLFKWKSVDSLGPHPQKTPPNLQSYHHNSDTVKLFVYKIGQF